MNRDDSSSQLQAHETWHDSTGWINAAFMQFLRVGTTNHPIKDKIISNGEIIALTFEAKSVFFKDDLQFQQKSRHNVGPKFSFSAGFQYQVSVFHLDYRIVLVSEDFFNCTFLSDNIENHHYLQEIKKTFQEKVWCVVICEKMTPISSWRKQQCSRGIFICSREICILQISPRINIKIRTSSHKKTTRPSRI